MQFLSIPLAPKVKASDKILDFSEPIGLLEANALLRHITIYERDTLILLCGMKFNIKTDSRLFEELLELDNKISKEICETLFYTIYTLDFRYFSTSSQERPTHALVMLNNNKYLGHIYLFINDDIITFVGIRSSIKNLLTKEFRGLSQHFLTAIRQIADSMGIPRIGFEMPPVGSMRHIAEKCNLPTDHAFDPHNSIHRNCFTDINYIIRTLEA